MQDENIVPKENKVVYINKYKHRRCMTTKETVIHQKLTQQTIKPLQVTEPSSIMDKTYTIKQSVKDRKMNEVT